MANPVWQSPALSRIAVPHSSTARPYSTSSATRGRSARPTSTEFAPWRGRFVRTRHGGGGEPASSRLRDPPRRRTAPGQPGRALHPPRGLRRGAAWVMSSPQNIPGLWLPERPPVGEHAPAPSFARSARALPSSPPWPASRRAHGAAYVVPSPHSIPELWLPGRPPAGGRATAPSCCAARRRARRRAPTPACRLASRLGRCLGQRSSEC